MNTRVAEFFLKDLLPPMPLDHHGRAIADVIPKCVRHDIAYLAEYLDSRFLSTKQLKKISRAEKLMIKVNPEDDDEKYYITAVDLWPDERLIKERVFEPSESGAEIDVCILDLPKLHNPNDAVA